MYPDKSLSTIFDPPSPCPSQLPTSPAPAYSALPYRDVDFFAAPLLDNKVGEIELETTDGKRFLVHKKLLEAETVFFHIYYGFVPVWQIAGSANRGGGQGTNALNNILCLPKIIVNHLSRSPPVPRNSDTTPAPPTQPAPPTTAPPVPPKDYQPVTAPTPTTSPYTWVVPETSQILMAFLQLLYPPCTFLPTPTSETPNTPIPSYTASQSAPLQQTTCLTSLDITARVIRASLGYQCNKTLNMARDHLMTFLPEKSVQVYALATFFKFTDLAKLASYYAISVPMSQWPDESLVLMGRGGVAKLQTLQRSRYELLLGILDAPLIAGEGRHWQSCVRSEMAERLWKSTVERVKRDLKVDSDLLELVEMDVRGGQCGECLMVLGENVKRCLDQVKLLPKTV